MLATRKMRVLDLHKAVLETERESIITALKQTKGHRIQAAKLLSISRKSLWKKMRKLNIAFPR